MTNSQRARLRIVIEQSILVRRGELITQPVAEERARNMVTIVEMFFSELGETPTPVDFNDPRIK